MAGRVLLIEAPFYKHITDQLVAGATAVLDNAGFTYDRVEVPGAMEIDRKSTRLNSSHITISYAVFCLKKKICTTITERIRLMVPGIKN